MTYFVFLHGMTDDAHDSICDKQTTLIAKRIMENNRGTPKMTVRQASEWLQKHDQPAAVTSRGLETSDGESVCEFCNRVGAGSPAMMGGDTIHYCNACRANDARRDA